jgi:hypothetical protein
MDCFSLCVCVCLSLLKHTHMNMPSFFTPSLPPSLTHLSHEVMHRGLTGRVGPYL